ncbi:glycerol-3-phosphate 1-O-acyltransferase PlsY [Verrucomicrobium sp. BvORR034]|jgi:glycerol-3-phosphate acyltransferase PlsY|uniref:glycerol-3-phosphate 1-O-acyltransferase PlsY n=1 Tax=Verrucomicrobium sp. BvORR034 TaxID=1396418 RepID=UPI000679625A|nr:glycerol-3-phosphate 1-O-acyltransferase PlsY [Verrucomicrobium sp. BvORR034]
MNIWVAAIIAIALAYLSGSLPFGYWAGLMKGVDIRKHGSGNIGATNVIRVLGKKTGIPVFVLDMLKGLLPTLFAQAWLSSLGASSTMVTTVAVLCAAASVIGHSFTFWLGFKGGKGVATSAGAFLGLAPWALLVAFVVWLVLFFTTRYVALASIGAAISLPISMYVIMLIGGGLNVGAYILLALGLVMGILVVVRHRSNIKRMMSGTESRFNRKSKDKKGGVKQ